MQPIFNPMNNNITSQNLTNLEVMELYNPKYNLSESDIKKYITPYDNITSSLGCNKYNLTEGITNNKNKYNNILIDLYHQTIPSEIIDIYPIGIVFNIKQDQHNNIHDLSKTDINNYKSSKSIDMNFSGEFSSDNYFYQDMQDFKYNYSNYSGNSYTYYVFKQLIKLLLTEVYLYEYKDKIYTHKELIIKYHKDIINSIDPISVKSISELIESKEIVKVKYKCIKISDPCEINWSSIGDLHISLVDVNKLSNFQNAYESIIKKNFNDFLSLDKIHYLNKDAISVVFDDLNKRN